MGKGNVRAGGRHIQARYAPWYPTQQYNRSSFHGHQPTSASPRLLKKTLALSESHIHKAPHHLRGGRRALQTYGHRSHARILESASVTHFVAMKSTLSTSLTPARRHESIWHTSIASAWSSCLNTIRLCACSPVATPIPYSLSARRIAACPKISSGAVGSSINLIHVIYAAMH
jgi:hypothetical protein